MNNLINKVLKDDCLRALKKIDNNSIDMIYLDPPFFTQKTQKLSNKNNDQYSFDDSWTSLDEYLDYIKDRLIECHRVLKDTGSIFVHLDKTANHYIRVILDEVFGIKNFRNEIIWKYKRWSNSKSSLMNSHQNIYFYSKSSKYKFNKVYEDYADTTNLDQIFQKRVRDDRNKTVYKKDSDGNVELLASKSGVPLSDVWEIPFLNPKAKERNGYPTQKPILLLDKIVQLTTDENDIILDPFCGSGTTLVSAVLNNRQYIGIDNNPAAVELSKNRLKNPIKTESALLRDGSESYKNNNLESRNVLDTISYQIVRKNNGIDAFLKIKNQIKPVPIKIQKSNETIEEAEAKLLENSKKNNYQLKILILNEENIQDQLFNKKDPTIIYL
jgi:site-specific DNA-methyltransferase (adenine-specific)